MAKPKRDEKPANYQSKSEAPKQPEKDPILEKVIERFELARDYAKNHYYEIWENSWKAYHNKRTESQYDGVADNYVPETFTIVESIKANIIGGEQRFEYYPTRSDQNADTKALNSLVEHYWYVNNFPAESLKWVQDDIALGTGIMWTFWDETRGVVPLYVPLKDNFIDPTAKNYQEAQDAGFRYLATVDQLKDEKVVNVNFDEEQKESDKNPRFVPRFKNLDKLKDMPRKDKDELDKERKDQLLGSTLGKGAKDSQVEVIWYIDKEKLVQIANRCVVIEEVETPFKREAKTMDSFDNDGNPVQFELPEIPAFLPLAPARNYIDGSLFYGKGDIEVILGSQELLNDTSNQKTDNLTYIVNKIALVDPAYSDEEDKLDSVPGAKWFIPPGAVEWLNMQPIGADADNEMARITDSMRRATAADEIIQGKGSGGRTTATEIRAQLAQAGTRFSIKLKNLEREGLKILADNMFKLIQINVTQETAVRTIGPEGAEFLTFNPGEYLGDYEPRVMLDTTAAAVAEEEKQNAMMFYQMASQMPFVDQMQLFKQSAEKMFGMEPMQIEALIQQPDPAAQDMMMQQMAQQQMQEGGTDIPEGLTPEDVVQ